LKGIKPEATKLPSKKFFICPKARCQAPTLGTITGRPQGQQQSQSGASGISLSRVII